jgi:hypothetical protein
MPQLNHATGDRQTMRSDVVVIVARSLAEKERRDAFIKSANKYGDVNILPLAGTGGGRKRPAAGIARTDRALLEKARGQVVEFHGIRKQRRRQLCEEFDLVETGAPRTAIEPGGRKPAKAERVRDEPSERLRDLDCQSDALYDEIAALLRQRSAAPEDMGVAPQLQKAYQKLHELEEASAILMSERFESRMLLPPKEGFDILEKARRLLERHENPSAGVSTPPDSPSEKA